MALQSPKLSQSHKRAPKSYYCNFGHRHYQHHDSVVDLGGRRHYHKPPETHRKRRDRERIEEKPKRKRKHRPKAKEPSFTSLMLAKIGFVLLSLLCIRSSGARLKDQSRRHSHDNCLEDKGPPPRPEQRHRRQKSSITTKESIQKKSVLTTETPSHQRSSTLVSGPPKPVKKKRAVDSGVKFNGKHLGNCGTPKAKIKYITVV
ncbi:hypothetical protein F4779DRAFT_303563 [Xylariaceae sp. FL0662B]|nr:hypothetical protein F4779DRAFT_303563 [Xylariaceae sp. FL0662B]